MEILLLVIIVVLVLIFFQLRSLKNEAINIQNGIHALYPGHDAKRDILLEQKAILKEILSEVKN